jgi:hypothetical protein
LKKTEILRDLTPEYNKYLRKKKRLNQIIKEEHTNGIGLKYLPKILPKT